MFMIIKQILILDKVNESKHETQFLNNDFIFKGKKKAFQTYLGLCEKVKCLPC